VFSENANRHLARFQGFHHHQYEVVTRSRNKAAIRFILHVSSNAHKYNAYVHIRAGYSILVSIYSNLLAFLCKWWDNELSAATLSTKSKKVDTEPSSDPVLQYSSVFYTDNLDVGVYSGIYPKTSRDETPISTIVLNTYAVSHGEKAVLNFLEEYKSLVSEKVGKVSVDISGAAGMISGAGGMKVQRWTWEGATRTIEIEYVEISGKPDGAKVTLSMND